MSCQSILQVGLCGMLVWACSHTPQPSSFQDLLSKDGKVFWVHEADVLSTEQQQHPLDLQDASQEQKELVQMYQSGAWQKMVKRARVFLMQHPFDEFALTLLSAAYLNLGNVGLAHYYADQVLTVNQTNSAALNIKGICSYKTAYVMDDYRNALALFNLAVGANKKETAAGTNAGYLQLELGNNEGSLMEFERVLKRCKHCLKAKLGKGIATYRLHKKDEARTLFEEVLDVAPQNTVAMYYMALSFYKENVEKSNSIFEDIIRISREDSIEIQEKSRYIMRNHFQADKNKL
ncbi:MAG: tetratricopeptide repeat protein [Zetaproteobacteria bacterium]|nr:tetratricopeptide repeat protein [Zetaproteobacteria bacterium]